jgi:hypothetical protein
MRAGVAGALAALAAAGAAAQEPPLCAPLRDVLAQANAGFAALRTPEIWTSAESNRAKTTLPRFDACFVDQINPAFWCLARPEAPGAATAVAEAVRGEIAACHPLIARQEWDEQAEPGVRRYVAQWIPGAGRRMRLVERRPIGDRPGSVFLYVY